MSKRNIGLLAALLLSAACAREFSGFEPPPNSLYFPVSVTLSPDHRYAYIPNTNFDLRYNAGWVTVLDLDAALAEIDAGNNNPTSALTSRVKVVSLAGNLSISEAGDVAVVASRGGGTLTLMEVSDDGSTLSCGDPDATEGLNRVEERTDCDAEHMVRMTTNLFPGQTLEEQEVVDPFTTLLFTWRPEGGADGRTLAAVGHMTASANGSRVSLFEVDRDAPELVPVRSIGLPAVSPLASLVLHPATNGTRVVGISQRFSTSVSPGSTLFSIDISAALAAEDEVRSATLVDVGGDELFGLVFSSSDTEANGRRAYVTNRSPDTVVVLDSTLVPVEEEQADGTIEVVDRPRYRVLGAVPIPDDPGGIAYVGRDSGDLIAVASLNGDVIELLAPLGNGLRRVGRFEDVGLGPLGMAHAHRQGRDLLLVTTFYDHGLVIFDLTAENPADFVRLAHIRSDATEPVTEVR
jgi:hypothetical protein